MEPEKHGKLTTVEITRMIEYLYRVGLTAEQIYEYFAYVAIGVRIFAPPVKVK